MNLIERVKNNIFGSLSDYAPKTGEELFEDGTKYVLRARFVWHDYHALTVEQKNKLCFRIEFDDGNVIYSMAIAEDHEEGEIFFDFVGGFIAFPENLDWTHSLGYIQDRKFHQLSSQDYGTDAGR